MTPKKRPLPTNADIGKRLQERRKMAGMTQAELGDAMGGVTYQSVSQYENGVAAMTALQLAKAARALGCKTEDLIP